MSCSDPVTITRLPVNTAGVGANRSGATATATEIGSLATDLEEVLTTLRFPESHRKRIRTTNLLERLFGEGRRFGKMELAIALSFNIRPDEAIVS